MTLGQTLTVDHSPARIALSTPTKPAFALAILTIKLVAYLFVITSAMKIAVNQYRWQLVVARELDIVRQIKKNTDKKQGWASSILLVISIILNSYERKYPLS